MPEQVAGLVEGRVGGLGLDQVAGASTPRSRARARGRPARRAGWISVPPERDHAGGLAGSGWIVAGVEQVQDHGDDLALEAGGARAHVALQGVLVGEEPERLVEEGVVLVLARSRWCPSSVPSSQTRVLLGRHLPQLAEDAPRPTALARGSSRMTPKRSA